MKENMNPRGPRFFLWGREGGEGGGGGGRGGGGGGGGGGEERKCAYLN